MPGKGWIKWPGSDRKQTRAANCVLDLYRDIFGRFRKLPTPMPIVVLQAEEPAVDLKVSDIVQDLHSIYAAGGLLCRELSPEQVVSRNIDQVPHLPDWPATRGDPENPRDPDNRDKLDELQRYGHALAMVRSLVNDNWDNCGTSQYRPYKFPRSRMLEAIEDEYKACQSDRKDPFNTKAVLLRLGRRSWRRPHSVRKQGNLATLLSPASLLGALVVTVAGAAAAVWLPHLTAVDTLGIAVLALIALIAVQLVRNNLGPLSWLTQACLWFATTTFLVPDTVAGPASRSALRWRSWIPSRSWEDRLARARLVIEQLIVAEGGRARLLEQEAPDSPAPDRTPASFRARHVPRHSAANHVALMERGGSGSVTEGTETEGTIARVAVARVVPEQEFAEVRRAWRFYLELRVLALLEDLRANHSPWHADLRHRKRTCPPLAFLPHAGEQNGGLAFLQAISDIRSRRSEQDPLLLLAGVPCGEDIEHREDDSDSAHEDGRGRYESWLPAMRANQSPSCGSTWPWVLRYPITRLELQPERTEMRQPCARRSWWTRIWSRRSLCLMLVLGVVATVVLYNRVDSREAAHTRQLARMYCGGNLASSTHDLVRSPQSPGQCVGIDTTDALEFVPRDGGVRLNGGVPQFVTGDPGVGAGISLRDLERLIMAQNRTAEQARSHITLVYAGALTSAKNETGEMQAAGAVKELAGVYTWQAYANKYETPLVRIDIANGGQDMDSQVVMAQKVVAAARQDPTIAGVVGLGRDTPTSPKVLQDLAAADLAVVDTTNSDDALAQDWNYFGLAATNTEEADSLQPTIAHVSDKTAVVFLRQGRDPYSHQQATAGQAMLHAAHFSLIGHRPISYVVVKDRANFETADASSPQSQVCNARTPPSVIYLAGRSDDLRGLMSLISDNARCFPSHVTVLSGDDLTKSELTGATYNLPANVTVYYAALADVAQTGGESNLAPDLQSALGLKRFPGYGDPFFADGTVALAFDAAHALYRAATQASDRAGVPSYMRCTQITGAATGQVWFTGVRHGIAVVRVTGEGNDVAPRIKFLPYSPATGPATTSAPCRPAVS